MAVYIGLSCRCVLLALFQWKSNAVRFTSIIAIPCHMHVSSILRRPYGKLNTSFYRARLRETVSKHNNKYSHLLLRFININ